MIQPRHYTRLIRAMIAIDIFLWQFEKLLFPGQTNQLRMNANVSKLALVQQNYLLSGFAFIRVYSWLKRLFKVSL
jgi:hypothetical protein